MKLNNRVAIITGGSGGIGQEVAKAFLAEGAVVVIAARKEGDLEVAEHELRQTSSRISTYRCDVAKSEEVQGLIAATIDQHGRIDVIVNAAGTYGPIGSSDTVDLEEWKRTFDVNLFGPFDVIRQALPQMKKQGGGKIINFSGGGDGPLPNISAYSASKFAVLRLTETLAAELRNDHIDINAIAPGAVITKLFEQGLAAGREALGEETYAKLLQQRESGGVSPEKAAALCVFLASDDSNGLSGKFLSAVWDNWQGYTPEKIAELMAGDALTSRRKKDD